MTIPVANPPSRWRTRYWRLLGGVVLALTALLMAVTAALIWYVRTDAFRNLVRARLVAALEQVTGGRVELRKLSVVPFRFRVEAHDLTIHGTEPTGQAPYAHVDRLTAEIKVISVFERAYGFHSLALDHPVVHIIVYPDGSTNQPTPPMPVRRATSTVEQLFAISVAHLQITHGELLWNNQKIPFEIMAGDVSAQLDYSLLHRHYEVLLRAWSVNTRLAGQRPLTSAIAARIILGQNYATLDSLEWSAGESRLTASGRLDNFQSPKFTGDYNGRLNLRDLASIRNLPPVRGGILEVRGRAVWAPQNFFFSGKAAVKDLVWRGPEIFLSNAAGTAQYAVSSSALRIFDIQARMLGGTATGALETANWLVPEAAPKKGPSALEKGSFTVKLKDIAIGSLAAAVGTRQLPLDRLHLAGSVGGTVDGRWTGSVERAETVFQLAAIPGPQSMPGEIPLSGSAAGTYHGSTDSLELANLSLASRSTQVQASGKLSSTSLVRMEVSTSDLREWQPILATLGGPSLPVSLPGRASFRGNASGRLRDFVVAGHLEANNFDTLMSGSRFASAHAVHWDSLTADLNASLRTIAARNAILKRGPTRIRFDASASLVDGQFTNSSPIAAHVEVSKAELADLASLAEYNYPASGVVNLSLTASGTRADPHGDGHVELRNGSFYGQPLTRLTSELDFAGHQVRFNHLAAAYRDGEIAGDAVYNSQTRAFGFNLKGTNFDLIHSSTLQASKVRIAGKLDFTANGDGTREAPVVNAKIRLRDLSFDKERAGDFTIDAVTHGADMQLTGRSNFENARLAIDGAIRLRGDWPAHLALGFDAFDIDSLLRPYVGSHVTSHVPAVGSLELSGPILRPSLLQATADLTSLSASFENVSVHNEGPIHFTVANQVLALKRLRLVGDGTDITAQGTVQLTGTHDIDVGSDGRVNLKLMEGLAPGWTGSGIVSVAVRVGGTSSTPSLAGKLEVASGSVSSMDLPNGLSEMNGTLVFNQDRLQIQTLNARVGGGNVTFSGFMTYSPHINFNIGASAHAVRLRPAGISARSDAELRLTGTSRDAHLSGDVTVLKLNLTPGFDFARYLEGFRQTTSLPAAGSLVNNLRLDIHVVTTPELQMETAAAKVSGDADLRLRGTLLRPVLLGRVDILEGDVYFSGTKYRLERGEITFTGPTGIKPTLDLEATTRVRDYDISLGVNGTPDKLNVTYRSEPPLPSADIVALLALGRTESESSLTDTSSQAVSQQASNAILSQALNATLSSRSQRLFGISRIKVDPNGLNTETTPTRTAPAVTLEQQVSSNLTLTYSTEVSQTSQQFIQGEYNVTRNISILGVRDQNGVLSFDVILRHRRQ